ncbi:hypothetical protein GGX14DRAFT_393498 [Mycena pura]|uniref:Uncharacterized protein n=1 Tax=Mycena pura TaxID=153505 RepID=A0AAD6VGZ5_9AGAR|nr:hypothetical protein GGX14DRAFT_393498 [Mycena pura]
MSAYDHDVPFGHTTLYYLSVEPSTLCHIWICRTCGKGGFGDAVKAVTLGVVAAVPKDRDPPKHPPCFWHGGCQIEFSACKRELMMCRLSDAIGTAFCHVLYHFIQFECHASRGPKYSKFFEPVTGHPGDIRTLKSKSQIAQNRSKNLIFACARRLGLKTSRRSHGLPISDVMG